MYKSFYYRFIHNVPRFCIFSKDVFFYCTFEVFRFSEYIVSSMANLEFLDLKLVFWNLWYRPVFNLEAIHSYQYRN